MPSERTERTRRIVTQRLESLERSGVMQLPKGKAKGGRSSARKAVHEDAAPQASVGDLPKGGTTKAAAGETGAAEVKPAAKRAWQSSGGGTLFEAAPSDARAETQAPTLEVLQQLVTGCTRCEELARTRTQTVFGVGDPKSRLCFLGEAPGADEDRLGEPFVGRAGQLLTKIIEACKLRREDVYILNMLKCRPPGNRNPLPDELTNCRGYLERQMDLIQPEFICCLGAVASQNLLGTTIGIGKLRGKLHSYRGAKVVCTYHPAFLLRSPSFKKETWEDMKFLMREMGVEI